MRPQQPPPSAPASSSSSARWIGASLIAFGVTYSCVARDEAGDEIDPAVTETLAASAACVTNTSAAFESAAVALHEKTDALAEAPNNAEAKTEAQAAWRDAMSLWQQLEGMSLGPAGSSNPEDQGGAVGGQDLGDEIYSWPTINACRIDQGIVSQIYQDSLSAEAPNTRGLDALEYLLFYDGAESSCAATVAIISQGDWDAVSDLPERRALYARAAAELVEAHATDLAEAWDAAGGNFAASLTDAGTSGPYETQADALNAVTDALFYIEETVKDEKLMGPLGLKEGAEGCGADLCPESVEHPQAEQSKQSIRDNLLGFETLFLGCADESESPGGIDALLRDKGADTVATQIQNAIEGVEEALDAIEEEDLRDALAADQPSVLALHDALKVLTDLLKNEVIVVLEVNIPTAVGGDND